MRASAPRGHPGTRAAPTAIRGISRPAARVTGRDAREPTCPRAPQRMTNRGPAQPITPLNEAPRRRGHLHPSPERSRRGGILSVPTRWIDGLKRRTKSGPHSTFASASRFRLLDCTSNRKIRLTVPAKINRHLTFDREHPVIRLFGIEWRTAWAKADHPDIGRCRAAISLKNRGYIRTIRRARLTENLIAAREAAAGAHQPQTKGPDAKSPHSIHRKLQGSTRFSKVHLQ